MPSREPLGRNNANRCVFSHELICRVANPWAQQCEPLNFFTRTHMPSREPLRRNNADRCVFFTRTHMPSREPKIRPFSKKTSKSGSHTGYILMMNCGPISWKSRREDNVSLRTSEAEFVAASLTAQEAIYLRETLTDFGFSQTKTTLLYKDNLACVAMSKNLVRRKFSRHTDVCKYYVQELVLAGFLKLVPLRTHKMVADALTKSLPSLAFVRHHQIMTGHASFAAQLLPCVGG